jgi:hypothetical protein
MQLQAGGMQRASPSSALKGLATDERDESEPPATTTPLTLRRRGEKVTNWRKMLGMQVPWLAASCK